MSSQTPDWTTTTPRKVGEVWVRREGDQTAIYDPKTGLLYALNASALALWELCDGGTTAPEMAEALSELTGVAAESTLEDVVDTLKTLFDEGLISGGDFEQMGG